MRSFSGSTLKLNMVTGDLILSDYQDKDEMVPGQPLTEDTDLADYEVRYVDADNPDFHPNTPAPGSWRHLDGSCYFDWQRLRHVKSRVWQTWICFPPWDHYCRQGRYWWSSYAETVGC